MGRADSSVIAGRFVIVVIVALGCELFEKKGVVSPKKRKREEKKIHDVQAWE